MSYVITYIYSIVALGDTCTANGGECADIANSECSGPGSGLVCTCKSTHKSDGSGGCTPKGSVYLSYGKLYESSEY